MQMTLDVKRMIRNSMYIKKYMQLQCICARQHRFPGTGGGTHTPTPLKASMALARRLLFKCPIADEDVYVIKVPPRMNEPSVTEVTLWMECFQLTMRDSSIDRESGTDS